MGHRSRRAHTGPLREARVTVPAHDGRGSVPDFSAWADAEYAAVRDDPRRPAGAALGVIDGTGWQPQRGAARWVVRMVGLVQPDADETVVGDPERRWPVWVRPWPPPAVVVQIWSLIAGPPGQPVWMELRWRPGDDAAQPGLFGWERSSAQAAQQVLAGGVALLIHVQRRGPKGHATQKLYERLCRAWEDARADGIAEPTQAQLATAAGYGERTIRRWLRKIDVEDYEFPPDGNIGR